MKKKINIAELLKDCPKGMELYSPLFGDCKFVKVHDYEAEIIVELETGATVSFLTDGRYYDYPNAECILFPKGKTTWEGFTPPCQLKDGDILSNGICICLYNGNESDKYYGFYVGVGHIDYPNYFINHPQNSYFTKENSRFATEEEKQKLFQAIKDNGYEWNAETKTLEKLPKFKIEKGKWYVCTKDLLDNYANKAFCKDDTYLSTQDGSLIPSNSNVPFEVVCASTYFRDWTINDAKDGDVLATSKGAFIYNGNKGGGSCPGSYCGINTLGRFQTGIEHHWTGKEVYPATKEQSDFLFQKIKEAGYRWNAETKTLEKLPKFKVGDKIKYKNGKNIDGVEQGVVLSITDDTYDVEVTNDMGIFVPITDQDNWKLVPNKFDITTLKPLKSEVLVRDWAVGTWKPSFWGKYIEGSNYSYLTTNGSWKQCIPYKGNEHLLGTTDDCNEFYKTWE